MAPAIASPNAASGAGFIADNKVVNGKPSKSRSSLRNGNAATYERARAQIREISRRNAAAAADVGNIPPPANPRRRKDCEMDLHRFMVMYFPDSAGLAPFGDAQIEAIKRMERIILGVGRFLNLLPRGYTKSTTAEIAALWAVLYGHRRFVGYFGATEDDASQAITSIKQEIQNNVLLAEDFPEVTIPIGALEGKSGRTKGQTQGGQLTHIAWKADLVALPTVLVPENHAATRKWNKKRPPALIPAPSSGSIVCARSLLAAGRGMRHKRADGIQARPDFAIIDDPQTDESAMSPAQCAKRLACIRKSILKLGGHGHQIAAVMNATVIAEGDLVDQLADHEKFPEWQSVRVPMMPSLPTHLDKEWLGNYAKIRRSYDRRVIGDQERAHSDATAYYQANRAVMDEGAEVSWEHIPLEKGEVSPVQHAMNMLIDDGQEVFDSECQNQPKRPMVSHAIIAETLHYNGYKPGEVPGWASYLVFHIDVHLGVHYYSVAAVGQDYQGAIINYGTNPRQPGAFDLINARHTCQNMHPELTPEEALANGLAELVHQLCSHPWTSPDGQQFPVNLGLIDAGYKPEIVEGVIRRSDYASVLKASRGIGIGPDRRPMPEYNMGPDYAVLSGPDPNRPRWYVPRNTVARDAKQRGRRRAQGKERPDSSAIHIVQFDANYWKSLLHSRLMVPPITGATGGEGGWTIYGDSRTDHSMYTAHLTAERPIPKTHNGRTVDVWEQVGGRDNHWMDTATGCAVAASVAGARLGGYMQQPPPPKKIKRRPMRFYTKK